MIKIQVDLPAAVEQRQLSLERLALAFKNIL
jgi:hypothetical protein